MTDSFLVDTNIEVHSHPFVHEIVAVHEVVEVSFVEAYDHPNVVSVPMELDWADLDLFFLNETKFSIVKIFACILKYKMFKLPGDSSDTGVLDGVGLCPGGRKCEGDPLLEPLPCPPVKSTNSSRYTLNSHSI